ncbi:MAG: arsenate reductase family protein [Actinobacteria bacterium]|nr:MAG: arsenate reductase family protein [Actinomycetota bacterium]
MGARSPLVHASLIADGHFLCLGIRTKGLYGHATKWDTGLLAALRQPFDLGGLTDLLDVRRYLEAPPTAAEIEDVLERLGLQPWDITRMGEPRAEELGLADLARDRDQWIALLAANPSLIQRPIIITADGSAWVARSPAEVEKALAADQA